MREEGYTSMSEEKLDSFGVHADEQDEIWHERTIYEAEFMEI